MRRKAWNGVYKLIDLGEEKEEKSTYHEIDIDAKMKENQVFEIEPELKKAVVQDDDDELLIEHIKRDREYKPRIFDLDDDYYDDDHYNDDYSDNEDDNEKSYNDNDDYDDINKIIFDSEIKDFDDFDDYDDMDLDEDIESIISKI